MRNILYLSTSLLFISSVHSESIAFSSIESHHEYACDSRAKKNLDVTFGSASDEEVETISKAYSHSVDVDSELDMESYRSAYANEPLVVLDEDGNPKISQMLQDVHSDIIEMNDFVYHLVKGDVRLSDENLQKLEANGWQRIGGFTGLEGRFSDFGDMLSGYVMYHPQKNIATVVYHGTATIDDGVVSGWETNFDAAKFKSHNIEKELVTDGFLKLKNMLASAKKELGSSDYKALKKAVNKELMEQILYKEDFTLATMNAFETVLRENLKVVEERINHRPDGSKAKSFLRKWIDDVLTSFALKSQLVNDAQELGLNLAGETHKGFTKKYLSTKRELLGLMQQIVQDHDGVKFIFSGHSQAGGVGNIALNDIAANHASALFGEGFNNVQNARLFGMFFSAARAGDSTYKKQVHRVVGQPFILNQNVHGDPVPIAAGDKATAEKLKGVPVLGEYFQQVSNYDDTGMLLLDNPEDTFQRAKQLYVDEGRFTVSEFDNFDEAMRYVASWAVDPNSIPEFLLSPEEKKSGVQLTMNPLSWLSWIGSKAVSNVNKASTYYKVVKLGNLMRQALNGDKKAQQKIGALLEARYAHLHYGYHMRPDNGEPDRGAVFQPEIVGRDLNEMLKAGVKQRSKKSKK